MLHKNQTIKTPNKTFRIIVLLASFAIFCLLISFFFIAIGIDLFVPNVNETIGWIFTTLMCVFISFFVIFSFIYWIHIVIKDKARKDAEKTQALARAIAEELRKQPDQPEDEPTPKP